MDNEKLILKLLRENPSYRDNEERLYFRILCEKGYAKVEGDRIIVSLSCVINRKVVFATIERCKRIIAHEHEELAPTKRDVRKRLQVQARETYGHSIAFRD